MTENKIRKNYDQLRSVYGALGLSVVDDVHSMARLDRLEHTLHRHAEDECSFPMTDRQIAFRERFADRAITEVEAMLPMLRGAVFVNGDPRGYALKIHDSNRDLIDGCGIARDWGGYGLIAPSANV